MISIIRKKCEVIVENDYYEDEMWLYWKDDYCRGRIVGFIGNNREPVKNVEYSI